MTTQVEEQIIIDGEKYPLINVPSLPEDSSIIQHKKGLTSHWSNCRRGFQGIWEIKDDRLYLIEFSSDSFELLCNLPILADWITGIGMVATGDSAIVVFGESSVAQLLNCTNLCKMVRTPSPSPPLERRKHGNDMKRISNTSAHCVV